MRFDDYLQRSGISVTPVDRFPGFVVEVGVPAGWVPFESAHGMWLWVCRTDPRSETFCANAVLTMHRVEASLEAHEVFTMLVDQQLQSVPGSHELRREMAAATDGDGVVGVLEMQISDPLGVIGSASRSRIIEAERELLIAQLTVTALLDSPAARANVWLTVRQGATAGPESAGHRSGGAPIEGTRGGH